MHPYDIHIKIGYEYEYPYYHFKRIRIQIIWMFSHPYPSLGGSASITIQTSAGMVAGTSAKATINVSGATGSAKIRSTTTGCGQSLGKHNVIRETLQHI